MWPFFYHKTYSETNHPMLFTWSPGSSYISSWCAHDLSRQIVLGICSRNCDVLSLSTTTQTMRSWKIVVIAIQRICVERIWVPTRLCFSCDQRNSYRTLMSTSIPSNKSETLLFYLMNHIIIHAYYSKPKN